MSFTKLYLTTKTAPYTPATIRGAWDDTAGAVTKALDSAKLDGGAVTSAVRGETNASTTYDVLLYRGISGPLDAQTISGTLDVVIAPSETDAASDLYWHLHVYVTQGDSDTPRGTLLTDYVENTTNEFSTADTGHGLQSAQTLSSLAISAGDRLVVEIGYIARNSLTTNKNGALWYGTQTSAGLDASDLSVGNVNGPTRAGFLLFSNAIAESPVGHRVSQLAIEVVTGNNAPLRVSQLAIEVVTAKVAAQRVSQLVVEIVRPRKQTPFRIAAHYSGAGRFQSADGEGTLTVIR